MLKKFNYNIVYMISPLIFFLNKKDLNTDTSIFSLKEFLTYIYINFIHPILPLLNIFWILWEATHFSWLFIAYIFYLFFYIFFLIYFLIKKLCIWYYFDLLIYTYYSFLYKVHNFYFAVNPRGFLNYKYLIRFNKSTRADESLRNSFLSTLDTAEARDIYSRVNDYIMLLKNRYSNSEYYLEEKKIIRSQIFIAVNMLEDLKIFYQTGGYKVAIWMDYYQFKEKYNFYWECCFYYDPLLEEKEILINKVKGDWLQFIMKLFDILILEDKNLILLDNYLFKYYNISVPFFLDEKNLDFKNICILKDSLSTLGFDLNSDLAELINYKLFLKCFNIFSEISEINNALFICEQIISNYILGVDKIIKHHLTKDIQKNIDLSLKDLKVAHKFW